jgi:hypothetical protein
MEQCNFQLMTIINFGKWLEMKFFVRSQKKKKSLTNVIVNYEFIFSWRFGEGGFIEHLIDLKCC